MARKYIIKNMSAKKFAKFLDEEVGACQAARDFAMGKTLKRALKKCSSGAWIEWLLVKTDWLTKKQRNQLFHKVDHEINSNNYVYYGNMKADAYRKYLKVE